MKATVHLNWAEYHLGRAKGMPLVLDLTDGRWVRDPLMPACYQGKDAEGRTVTVLPASILYIEEDGT